MRTTQNVATTGNGFNQYLLSEYENVAEAHFRTITTISSFFRYYLLIMALPVTLVAAAIGFSSKQQDVLIIISNLGPLLSTLSLVIATVGLCVLLYVINLRMDVLLYARTVNGIRKYFYDQAKTSLDEKLRMRVLPQSPSLPEYFEWRFFLPVVTSFALFNSFYFSLGLF